MDHFCGLNTANSFDTQLYDRTDSNEKVIELKREGGWIVLELVDTAFNWVGNMRACPTFHMSTTLTT